MKNKKGNIKIISIIILLVAISAGILGYMFSKINQSPNIYKQSVAVSDVKLKKMRVPKIQKFAQTDHMFQEQDLIVSLLNVQSQKMNFL